MFEYAKLTRKVVHGGWTWFLNERRLNELCYEIIEIMNVLGREGWELCFKEAEDTYILKRKIS